MTTQTNHQAVLYDVRAKKKGKIKLIYHTQVRGPKTQFFHWRPWKKKTVVAWLNPFNKEMCFQKDAKQARNIKLIYIVLPD